MTNKYNAIPKSAKEFVAKKNITRNRIDLLQKSFMDKKRNILKEVHSISYRYNKQHNIKHKENFEFIRELPNNIRRKLKSICYK